MEKKPRAHAEMIKQWADGAEIEYRRPGGTNWVLASDPAFVEDYVYRVKPAREYPEVRMTRAEVEEINREVSTKGHITWAEDIVFTINAGLRHAIDNGQVVTREEFKRVSDELGRAVCSLRAYGYTDEGGDLWKPPLGSAYLLGVPHRG